MWSFKMTFSIKKIKYRIIVFIRKFTYYRMLLEFIKHSIRAQTMNKMEKKKHHTSTMKPMSAHDEKTLNTAVAMANEITTKSMNDLGKEPKLPNSPSDRSKFHFKFPLSLHHTSTEQDKEVVGKQERRNFSEEANSVPDIHATITEESKLAYLSLIEQPTPTSSLMPQIDTASLSQAIDTKFENINAHIKPLPPPKFGRGEIDSSGEIVEEFILPPRNTKPKLVDKPRHIRKYPLKIPPNSTMLDPTKPIIYQNTPTYNLARMVDKVEKEPDADVVEDQAPALPARPGAVTNPFNTNNPVSPMSPSLANPFEFYLKAEDAPDGANTQDCVDGYSPEGALVKDYVSVEDLLEFADQKPCGRQRGVESDEVRIMSKVLKQQVTPEECLEALEQSEWNVHNAIKLMRVKISVGSRANLAECRVQLDKANGDILKAAVLVLGNKTQ